MNPVTLPGDGMLLRPWTAGDADQEMVDALNNPEIAEFLAGMPQPYTMDDAAWWVTEGAASAWANGGAAFSIRDRQTDRLLGGVGLADVRSDRKQGEIGYWVAPSARGRGVASEAARVLAEWCFANGLERLEILAAKENSASVRVAYAAGFAKEGMRREAGTTRDGGRRDLAAFVRLATDPPGPAPRFLPDLPAGGLTDGVVTVRRILPSDVDDFLALHLFPEVQHVNLGPKVTPDTAKTRCDQAEYNWLAGERAQCSILDAQTGEFAGDMALFFRDTFTSQAILGYSLRPEFRGKSFARRGAVLLTDWAFEHVGLIRIIAGTFPENEASRRVLQRAGFEREAYLKYALPGHDGNRIDDIQFVRFHPSLRPS